MINADESAHTLQRTQTDERHEETLETLSAWIAEYAVAKQRPLDFDPVRRIYFTNLFVSRVDWWLRDEVHAIKRSHESLSFEARECVWGLE
jgi:hypothetical protein